MGNRSVPSLLEGMTKEEMDLETALQLLSLPRLLGTHPDDGEEVLAGVGRYGPYVVHNRKFVSLKAPDNVLEVDLPRALAMIEEAPDRRRGGSTRTVLKELGEHPKDGEPVRVLDGRYGPYVNHNSTNANIPKETGSAECYAGAGADDAGRARKQGEEFRQRQRRSQEKKIVRIAGIETHCPPCQGRFNIEIELFRELSLASVFSSANRPTTLS